jgi:hypothetical protein
MLKALAPFGMLLAFTTAPLLLFFYLLFRGKWAIRGVFNAISRATPSKIALRAREIACENTKID